MFEKCNNQYRKEISMRLCSSSSDGENPPITRPEDAEVVPSAGEVAIVPDIFIENVFHLHLPEWAKEDWERESDGPSIF
jgi:hypothetical protein